VAHHTRVHFERDGYKMHTKSEEAEKEIDAQKDAQERHVTRTQRAPPLHATHVLSPAAHLPTSLTPLLP